jgi:hypothetical protein
MRKVIWILFLVTLSAQVNALVTFNAVDNSNATVTISYTTDGDEPCAIALRISCSDTLQITGGSGTDVAYNCFIDYAYSNDPYALGDGDPFANPDGPGAATLPASEISICMGVLDESGNHVGVTGSELESNLSGGGQLILPWWPDPDCMAETNPDYATWDSLGKPCCWCCQYQCNGDADCNQQFGILQVYSNDLACLISGYGKPVLPDGCAVCADFDHQMQFGVLRVYSDDLAVLVINYGQPTVLPCSTGLPNSDFNFWTDEECDPYSPFP